MLGEEPLGGHAIHIPLRAVAEDLAERCGQVVRIARGDAAHGLGHQRAVGIILVAAAMGSCSMVFQRAQEAVVLLLEAGSWLIQIGEEKYHTATPKYNSLFVQTA